MPSDVLIFLYVELAYSVVLNAIFGGYFIRKLMKLDKLSDNLDVTIPRRDWIKFGILLLIILLYVLHLILAYASPKYWLQDYSNFALIVFLYIANYMMQSYIVVK